MKEKNKKKLQLLQWLCVMFGIFFCVVGLLTFFGVIKEISMVAGSSLCFGALFLGQASIITRVLYSEKE